MALPRIVIRILIVLDTLSVGSQLVQLSKNSFQDFLESGDKMVVIITIIEAEEIAISVIQ